MIFHVTDLAGYASQYLQNQTSGYVHSVYKNTVNITVNGRLFALQTAGSPLSPISLITDLAPNMMEKISLHTGDSVSFCLTNAKVHDLCPKGSISHEVRHELYRKFSQIIQKSDTHGFDLIFQMSPLVDQDLILSAAETKIHVADTLFHKENYLVASDVISDLVGLGIGLTPSGDDFLCGILAGFHIQGITHSQKVSYLKDSIRQKLDRTNDISRAFLLCALDGHFSQAVNELWKNPDTETITDMFKGIGHSSGMDTLCGIYFLFFLME